MGEWFINVWNGIIEYAPQIAAIFSTIAASIGVPNIIGYFKQKKKISDLDTATQNLIEVTNKVSENIDVDELANKYEVVNKSVEGTATEVSEIKQEVVRVLNKVNLLLEALGKVYDYSIENPDVKNVIATIIGNARYGDETNTITELTEQLNKLREDMVQKTKALAESVQASVNTSKPTKKTEALRG